jgi:hypothetical protein
MFQRYLSLGNIPELRSDPVQSEKIGNELEVVIPVDIYWEVDNLLKEFRYSRINGNSMKMLWSKFGRLLYPCIVAEKDRAWFKKQILLRRNS